MVGTSRPLTFTPEEELVQHSAHLVYTKKGMRPPVTPGCKQQLGTMLGLCSHAPKEAKAGGLKVQGTTTKLPPPPQFFKRLQISPQTRSWPPYASCPDQFQHGQKTPRRSKTHFHFHWRPRTFGVINHPYLHLTPVAMMWTIWGTVGLPHRRQHFNVNYCLQGSSLCPTDWNNCATTGLSPAQDRLVSELLSHPSPLMSREEDLHLVRLRYPCTESSGDCALPGLGEH